MEASIREGVGTVTRFNLTAHAEARSRQRGIKLATLDVVFMLGEEAGDGLFVTRRGAREEISRLKARIHEIERAVNTCVIHDHDKAITTFKAKRPKKER